MRPDDQELARRLDALTRHAQPDEAVWQQIASRIDRSRHRPLPAAAAALAVFAVVAGIVLVDRPERSSSPMQTLVTREAAALRASAPTRSLPAGFQPPAAVDEAWIDNQTAIAELEAALERDPDNRMLLDFLAQARLREAELLRALVFPPEQRSL